MKEGAALAKGLPRREDIPETERWRLEDIYDSDEGWERDFQWAASAREELADYAGALHDAATVARVLDLRDRLGEVVERLVAYASMRLDENTADAAAQARAQRAHQLATEVAAAAAYIEPELLALPPTVLEQYAKAEPVLVRYRHYLSDLLRRRAHTLSPAEEALLARVDELGRTPRVVFDLFTDGDLRFPTITDEQGDKVQLSEGRFRRFLESRDRRVRREAFEALLNTYGTYRNTLGGLLAGSVRRDLFYSRARRYRSTREAALDADAVPVVVYDQLIEAVRSRLGDLHRYLALRKRLLDVSELHMYDLYAPIIDIGTWEMSFAEAAENVLSALRPLGEAYLQVVRRALDDGWIDPWENEGKRSGAYCYGVYGVHPFVLMNAQNRLDDAFTLAHELGHAVHDYYAHSSQPYIYAQPSIFTAEVASTLNEVLLYRHLQATAPDDRKRAYLMAQQLEQIRQTIFRQVLFAEFERDIHARAEAGEGLTWETFSEVYRRLCTEYYGAVAVIDEPIAMEWARIPHFYTSFYVFQYATGLSAAMALAQQIVDEGEAAAKRYIEFLRAGSSDYPLAILRAAGVDLASPEPVLKALDHFAYLVTELDAQSSRW